MKKIVSIVVVMIMSLIILNNFTFAYDPGNIEPDHSNTEMVVNVGNDIAGIIQVVGVISSVIVIAILGIQYMLGSLEEKAKYKETLMPYFIGAVLVFAASSISQLVFDMFSDFGA